MEVLTHAVESKQYYFRCVCGVVLVTVGLQED